MSIFGPGEKLTEQFVMQRDHQTIEKAKCYIKDPIITIWTEEIGSLKKGNYEFAFGSGGHNQKSSYVMLSVGNIFKMGF